MLKVIWPSGPDLVHASVITLAYAVVIAVLFWLSEHDVVVSHGALAQWPRLLRSELLRWCRIGIRVRDIETCGSWTGIDRVRSGRIVGHRLRLLATTSGTQPVVCCRIQLDDTGELIEHVSCQCRPATDGIPEFKW